MSDDHMRVPTPGKRMPMTPAGRWEVALSLLSPTYVETCPCCGQDVERQGEPLIDAAGVLAIMNGEEPELIK